MGIVVYQVHQHHAVHMHEAKYSPSFSPRIGIHTLVPKDKLKPK